MLNIVLILDLTNILLETNMSYLSMVSHIVPSIVKRRIIISSIINTTITHYILCMST